MIKLVYCVCRRPDLTEEAFRKYWLEQHAPLVRSVAKAIGAIRYVQSHTVQPEINAALMRTRGLEPPYDGITEVWWQDLETFQAAAASPEAKAARKQLLEDEARFIDFSRSRVFMTEEHVIFG